MMDRAISSLIATVAACAAAMIAVFASGFALFALLQPSVGNAGAGAAVALAAALPTGLYALYVARRAGERSRRAEAVRRELVDQLQVGMGDIAERHPVATLVVAAMGGILAARHPQLMSDLIALAARYGERSTPR